MGSSLTQTCTGKPYGQRYFSMKDLDYSKLDRQKMRIAEGKDIPINPCLTNDTVDIMEATKWNPPAAVAIAERAWEKNWDKDKIKSVAI